MEKFETVRPTVDKDIDVIWVFSGFGTYLRPFIHKQPEWGMWNDQKNIDFGIKIILETTALRLGLGIKEIDRDTIQQHGPILIYNGEPEQNEDLRYVLSSAYFPIPEGNVIIIDGVASEGNRPIANTLDQFKSFPREIIGKQLKRSIALVSGAPHFARILRYNSKFQIFPPEIQVRVFPVPSYDNASLFAIREAEKVLEYVKKGDLAPNPSPINLGLN